MITSVIVFYAWYHRHNHNSSIYKNLRGPLVFSVLDMSVDLLLVSTCK